MDPVLSTLPDEDDEDDFDEDDPEDFDDEDESDEDEDEEEETWQVACKCPVSGHLACLTSAELAPTLAPVWALPRHF